MTQYNYGNLRRRPRDASWQWLLVGTVLGLGFALVVCVGGYAVGAITFPVLEEETATPSVQISAQTDTLATLAVQQTQVAQTMAAITVQPIVATETPSSPGVQPTAEVTTPPAQVEVTSTPEPTPLPGATVTVESAAVALNQTGTQVSALPQAGTPVVGTPPVGAATPIIGLPTGPSIPPALDAIKTDMVNITGGSYLMGTTLEEARQAMDECALYGKVCDDVTIMQDSVPPHQVTVDSFQMEVYEVSLNQYVTFLNWLGPNSHKASCQGQPCVLTAVEDPDRSYIAFDGTTYSVRNPAIYSNHPVTLVTWVGAQAYCETLNRRLPTEAEWERAARGDQNFYYPWGNTFDTSRAVSSILPEKGTIPVDQLPNGASFSYGVHNMAGNVSEWVSDWYQSDYYTQQLNLSEPNPRGPISGTQKVHRGGSWDTIPLFLRTVHRMSQNPGDPTASIGFRCVTSGTSAVQPIVPVTPDTGSATTGNAAPTMAPPPTNAPLPTWTPLPGPTNTIAPG